MNAWDRARRAAGFAYFHWRSWRTRRLICGVDPEQSCAICEQEWAMRFEIGPRPT